MDTAGAQVGNSYCPAAISGLEQQLAAKLAATTDEVQHVECFDDEERAEVFAILQALRTDTEAHRAMAELLSRQIKGGGGDA